MTGNPMPRRDDGGHWRAAKKRLRRPGKEAGGSPPVPAGDLQTAPCQSSPQGSRGQGYRKDVLEKEG